MMLTDGIVALDGRQKIAGNQLAALMDQLIKGVLPVGTRFTPNYRPCGVLRGITVAGDAFSVAFHVALLKIGGETVHVLIVRQDGMSLRAEEIVVPNTQQPHDHR